MGQLNEKVKGGGYILGCGGKIKKSSDKCPCHFSVLVPPEWNAVTEWQGDGKCMCGSSGPSLGRVLLISLSIMPCRSIHVSDVAC